MEALMPENKALPTMEKYDGSTDPSEHLRSFADPMTVYSNDNLVWCKVFSLSLKGEAIAWFHSLEPRTIDGFGTLRNLFGQQYASSKPQELTYLALLKMRQATGETLRDFMDRFNRTVRQVKDVDRKFILNRVTQALRPRPLADTLYAEEPLTMVELQNRANKFIHVEEMWAYQQIQKEEYARVVGRDQGRKDGKQAREQDEGRNFKRREFLKGPRYTRYTPLSATRTRVMEEALQADLLTLIQAPTPKNVDGQKHCKYHQNLGHDIEDCGTLRDMLEELVREGHLKRYVQEEKSREAPRNNYPRQNNQHSSANGKRWEDRRGGRTGVERSFKGHINTISGGFAGGVATSSARKRHLRSLRSVNQADVRQRSMPRITFSNKDFHAPDPNQDDPMVIMAVISQYTVAKVLIDQGSSANILYWKTFQQMNLSKDIIASFNEQILGFAGERVDTMGYVNLRTSLGTERGAKELKVRFLLVEANTSYNVLLGRPCLNAFGAIVSTPHLTLKDPSNEGRICMVRADQRMARECYVAGLKMEP
ncbi:uncharacterized protein LOC108346478 [Vigna angularis]|uniref:uncharacterized protein LOC108346478 n=1 Tax=Phaseolus angularis TaxID=3914 RepID=UPI00080A7476|nr:uncharacterized protein LOC108346478 [Vigna angularis]